MFTNFLPTWTWAASGRVTWWQSLFQQAAKLLLTTSGKHITMKFCSPPFRIILSRTRSPTNSAGRGLPVLPLPHSTWLAAVHLANVAGSFLFLQKRREQVYRQRQKGGCVVFARHFAHGLEVA